MIEYPNTLIGLRLAAERVDQRYWKREGEKKHGGGDIGEKQTPGGGGNANQKGGGKKQFTHTASGSGQQQNKPRQASSTQAQAGSPPGNAGKTSAKPSYTDKLDSSGHINEAERERRRKNLCLYCGLAGHIAANCRKRATAIAKAVTATILPSASSAADVQSKK